jgi:cardiolipin synthase A/B
LCNALEKMFAEDKKDSRQVTLQQWENRTVIERGFDSICRLVAPLL